MNIDAFVRPNIRTLKPYRSARQDHLTGILLDANENAFGSVVSFDGATLNRYPDPFQTELRSRIAELNATSPHHVFVGVGSDEVIDLLMRIFCEPKRDAVLLLEPTYGMYRVAASIQDVQVRSCLLTPEFQIDVDRARAAVGDNTKLIFCCSPNNPTGNLLRAEDILSLCREMNAIVVVDEAYIDFATDGSVGRLVSEYPNLIVMRTLSKAWGLAGIRLGYCLADPTVISYLLKVKSPYNINALTNQLALSALQRQDAANRTTASIIAQRTRLMSELQHIPSVERIFPSDANFILVRMKDAAAVFRYLVSCGIIVRDRSAEPMLANCLRITVGTPAENDALLAALKDFEPTFQHA